MKLTSKTFLLFLLLLSVEAGAQLQTETRTVLYNQPGKTPELIIRPGDAYEETVTFKEHGYPVRRFLRVAGGVQMPGRFAPRGETLFREAESLIDDNLDSLNTYRNQFSLYFKGDNDPFERHAYNRITGVDFSNGKTTIEIPVKRNKLKIAAGGDFGVELQVYLKKQGRHADEVYDAADTIIYIPIPQGSGRFHTIRKELQLPVQTATMLMRVGGTNFSGECWVEAPRLLHAGEVIFDSAFTAHDSRKDEYNYWVGINLATRSWPLWRLEFNGQKVFEGNIFDRASNVADFYIPLPNNLTGTGRLTLSLLKEPHRAAFPYFVHSVELMEESARDFEIVSVPRYISKGDSAGILLEINKPDITLNINIGDGVVPEARQMTFGQTGLHVVQVHANSHAVGIPVQVSDTRETRTATIGQVVSARGGVYLSSGDEVHIDNVCLPYDYFFKWYMRERIGNWYQFRPSYQWSGVRITEESFARHYTSLLNKMKIPYAWQVEGRTLASSRINPSLEALQSPMFHGKQAHENDGGYYYWQHFHYTGLHADMAARTRPYGGIFAKHRPIYTDNGVFIHYDPYGVKDMADGANKLIANLSYSRGESTRHTGPSTMFRYLYQAGYDWLGAEQMYGPENIIMSSLRGASRAYHKPDFGSLHAMQWGSFPFTDPRHSLRFYLSLAVAYMHGSSHINTEEGLWTDEYANHRFTESGMQHMHAQHSMLDYIQTHSRRGELYTRIAVIQGRNDSWKSFGRTSVWSQNGDKWKFNQAQESFDLLKVFYPGCTVDLCGPDGWFTSAPYGPVDLLPIEASGEVLSRYKALIFLGWNSFDNADFIRLRKFVENGGTLLLTAAHLNSELQPDAPVKLPEDDTVIRTILGLDYQSYTGKTIIPLGKGKVIYYPETTYPADELIRASYMEDMHNVAARITDAEDGNGWIKASKHIDFTVWDSPEFRTIYLLNTDWKGEDKSHTAILKINNHEFPIEVVRYSMPTIRISNGIAAMMKSNTSDVLQINPSTKDIMVETTGPDQLTIFNGGNGDVKVVQLSKAGVTVVKE